MKIVTVRPNIHESIEASWQQMTPYFSRYDSFWIRRVLFSSFFNTTAAMDTKLWAARYPQRNAFNDEHPVLGADWPLNMDDIRWCESCLANGYHSWLHQIQHLALCPLHKAPLHTGCPHCKGKLSPVLGFMPLVKRLPRRLCAVCQRSILDIETCMKWRRNAEFLNDEEMAFGPLQRWCQQLRQYHYYFENFQKRKSKRHARHFADRRALVWVMTKIVPTPDRALFRKWPVRLKACHVEVDISERREPASSNQQWAIYRGVRNQLARLPAAPLSWLHQPWPIIDPSERRPYNRFTVEFRVWRGHFETRTFDKTRLTLFHLPYVTQSTDGGLALFAHRLFYGFIYSLHEKRVYNGATWDNPQKRFTLVVSKTPIDPAKPFGQVGSHLLEWFELPRYLV